MPNAFQWLLIAIGVLLLVVIFYLWQRVGCYQWRINSMIMILLYFIVGSIVYIKSMGEEAYFQKYKNAGSIIAAVTGKVNLQSPVKVDSFIGSKTIEGLENRVNSKNLLINNHIAGSYNSCFGNDANIASVENLKWVLKAGFRVVDFEIYMENNKDTTKQTNVPGKIAVIGSSALKLKNICPKDKKQPFMITEYPRGTVNVKAAFKQIAMYGFKGHKYKDLPLFINLRIKSPDARIYTLLADDIKVLKNYLPDQKKFGNYGSNRTNALDKLKYSDIYSNDLSRKVFIIVEDYCNNYDTPNSPFAPHINLAVGKNLQVYDSSELSTKELSPQEQTSELSLIKPDNTDLAQGTQTQPHLENSKFNGINFMLWNVRCLDCIEPISKTKNLGSRTINKEEAVENGIEPTKGYGFFGFFEQNYVVPRSKNIWKYEQNISAPIKTAVDPCNATNKCVRQYFNRNKGKWVFSGTHNGVTDPECDKKPEKFPRVVQLPQAADPETGREASECKVLDRKTMYNPE